MKHKKSAVLSQLYPRHHPPDKGGGGSQSRVPWLCLPTDPSSACTCEMHKSRLKWWETPCRSVAWRGPGPASAPVFCWSPAEFSNSGISSSQHESPSLILPSLGYTYTHARHGFQLLLFKPTFGEGCSCYTSAEEAPCVSAQQHMDEGGLVRRDGASWITRRWWFQDSDVLISHHTWAEGSQAAVATFDTDIKARVLQYSANRGPKHKSHVSIFGGSQRFSPSRFKACCTLSREGTPRCRHGSFVFVRKKQATCWGIFWFLASDKFQQVRRKILWCSFHLYFLLPITRQCLWNNTHTHRHTHKAAVEICQREDFSAW